MSGVVAGWSGFLLLNVVGISVLSFLLSFAVRPFVTGLTLVAVTVLLALGIWLMLAASGMAKSDFSVWFVVPFLPCAAVVAAIWLFVLKGQVSRG